MFQPTVNNWKQMDMLCRMKKERSSLKICRGKGGKWGPEPEISALMGANVELACPDREKHICAFFVDD